MLPQYFKAVHVRQPKVEAHEVGMRRAQILEHVSAKLEFGQVVSTSRNREANTDRIALVKIVVADYDFRG